MACLSAPRVVGCSYCRKGGRWSRPCCRLIPPFLLLLLLQDNVYHAVRQLVQREGPSNPVEDNRWYACCYRTWPEAEQAGRSWTECGLVREQRTVRWTSTRSKVGRGGV
ncbi:hypothetical protein LZ32DRAFT_321664 [Colletotrichum eremochloae]|nr:hypothetical protein LZ32DRAFT_321664 [Colletotrichum eremochloae]